MSGQFLTDTRSDAEVIEAIAPDRFWSLTSRRGESITVSVFGPSVMVTVDGALVRHCVHQGPTDATPSECAEGTVARVLVAGGTPVTGDPVAPAVFDDAVLTVLMLFFGTPGGGDPE